MILMFLCQHGHVCVKTWKVNVFVKPNEQCQACSNIVVARKCTFRETRKEQLTRSLVTCLLINLSTYQLASVCQLSERNLTLWVPFYSPIAHLAAKNRFSRRFVLMQKGVGLCMRQNEFIFKSPTACNRFWAICHWIQGEMVQNAVCFAAKCSAFWC